MIRCYIAWPSFYKGSELANACREKIKRFVQSRKFMSPTTWRITVSSLFNSCLNNDRTSELRSNAEKMYFSFNRRMDELCVYKIMSVAGLDPNKASIGSVESLPV